MLLVKWLKGLMFLFCILILDFGTDYRGGMVRPGLTTHRDSRASKTTSNQFLQN
jgi:hypothetical protein